MRKGNDQDSAEAIGELWNRQDEQESDFDYGKYNSLPWMILKTLMAVSISTLIFLLYALQELPWGVYGSGTGILLLAGAPFFSGMILGYSFENPKLSLAYAMIVGFVSIGITFALMALPYTMKLAEYDIGFMKDVWFYGFFIPFIITISFVPAGAMLAASTNVYE